MDHPRVCGEKWPRPWATHLTQGSPPHMRGKVWIRSPMILLFWDHPRVCGEKKSSTNAVFGPLGSPPRMRGKEPIPLCTTRTVGITPAYAGKSRFCPSSHSTSWDHPRVCGEKTTAAEPLVGVGGSPPRMRGKVLQPIRPLDHLGITPAYAGKSVSLSSQVCQGVDHPRVCGEKFPRPLLVLCLSGSPPRMRGKAPNGMRPLKPSGITPAYAGKSGARRLPHPERWDHPRVCGEKVFRTILATTTWGSPPRMRGKVY